MFDSGFVISATKFFVVCLRSYSACVLGWGSVIYSIELGRVCG